MAVSANFFPFLSPEREREGGDFFIIMALAAGFIFLHYHQPWRAWSMRLGDIAGEWFEYIHELFRCIIVGFNLFCGGFE